MINKVWKDPVWSKVIATGILAILVSVGTYFLDFWPSIKVALNNSWSFIFSSTYVPNWLVGIMTLLCVLFIYAILIELKGNPPKEELEKTFKYYTKDSFLGLLWCWRYAGNQIDNLHSLCPHCEYQILPKNSSSYSAAPGYEYSCDDCGYSAGLIEGYPENLNQKVKLKIQKTIRTEQWRERINA